MFTLDRHHFPPMGARSGPPRSKARGERTAAGELLLPRDPSAPGRARRELRSRAGQELDKDDLDVATLLVSELVTNAVIHSPLETVDPIALRIVLGWPALRVEVGDAGRGFDPGGPRPAGRVGGGRGLLLVERLADRWGARTPPGGEDGRFVVWFELDLEPSDGEPIRCGSGGR